MLAPTAKVTTYIPLLIEKFARQRLRAFGQVDGTLRSTNPGVLFFCVQNASRSQMAAGWLRHLGGNNITVWSGGSEPGSDPAAQNIAAIRQIRDDIRDRVKGLVISLDSVKN